MKLFVGSVAALVLFSSAAHGQCGLSGLSVTVSPASAAPGQSITVTLTNTTAKCTYNLPSLCLFDSVHQFGVSQAGVLNLFCGGALVPIGPGKSYSQTWDQLDDLGGQVADGSYVFEINIYDPSFNKLRLTPAVAISKSVPPPVLYGSRSAGSGGFEPQMGFADSPTLGNPSFHLSIADGLGGAPAMLLIGIAPGSVMTGWGEFLINPAGPLLSVILPLPGAGNGQGNLLIPAPIPPNPAFVGASAVSQTLIQDAASSGGISHTNGLQITISP